MIFWFNFPQAAPALGVLVAIARGADKERSKAIRAISVVGLRTLLVFRKKLEVDSGTSRKKVATQ